MITSGFRHIPRRNRAKGLVPKIERCSKRFKDALAEADIVKQEEASYAAWNAMTQLFEILRGEQDLGYLSPVLMQVPTGFLAERLSIEDQQKMMLQRKVDRSMSAKMDLRDALNKIAHWKDTSFRIDGRGAHYLILSGAHNGKKWIAEVSVSRLCRNARAAIAAISG